MKRLLLSRLSKKQWLIIGVALAIIATVIIGALVITKQRMALERDREKFVQLDTKMEKVLADFNRIAPEGKWVYEKGCYYAKTKFPEKNAAPEGCEIKIRSTGVTSQSYENFRKTLAVDGFVVGYPTYMDSLNAFGSSLEKDDVVCDLISSSKSLDSFYQGAFSCKSGALQRYF